MEPTKEVVEKAPYVEPRIVEEASLEDATLVLISDSGGEVPGGGVPG
jgi:hypothetical protein